MVALSPLITRRIFFKLTLASTVGQVVSQNDLWSYDGDTDPTHWTDLSTDYHTCGDGQRQSPIDIDITTARQIPVTFNYHPIPIALLNNGHTIQQSGDGSCTLTLDHQDYPLLQFHFHTPSEHTHGGVHYPMELHLVHKHPSGALVVVGLWLTPGREQPELAALSKTLPQRPGEQIKKTTPINLTNLLPQDQTLVRYSGSLTTPPCSEGVTWLVLTTPMEASPHQIEHFSQLLGNNARPLQRLAPITRQSL